MEQTLSDEDALNLIPILQKDDIESFKKLIFSYSTVNLVFATTYNDMPVCFRKRPYISDIAAYFNAIKCLAYIFSYSEHNVKHEDSSGRSLAHFAAYNGTINLFLLLEQNGIPTSTSKIDVYPIHIAAKHGRLKVCQWLWSNGSPINLLTRNGFSPIHLAAHFYHFDIVDFFLSVNCDINQHMGNGSTLLTEAIQNDNIELIEYIIKQSPQQVCDKKGIYPLHYCVSKRNADVLEKLIEIDADLSCQDKKGLTPLHYACQRGFYDMCDILLTKGADVSIIDSKGKTPLHYAAARGNVYVVQLLVHYGAEIDATDNEGLTPMNVAFLKKRNECVQYFKQISCDNLNLYFDDEKGFIKIN